MAAFRDLFALVHKWWNAGAIVVPDVEGCEWTLEANPCHWRFPANACQWTVDANQAQWTLTRED